MADNVKPTFAKSDVKSGLANDQYAEKVLDGIPAKKNVEAIDEQNSVHDAPGSICKKS
jgi:hypothetical protein